MRKIFVPIFELDIANEEEVIEEVVKQFPWADVITRVDGGYMCFESNDDLEIWQNQR
jgi:hypothetical protein